MRAHEKVNQIINDYFNEHLAHVDVTCGVEFQYDIDDDKIIWGMFSTERQDNTFSEFFENILGCRHINPFIYSIFHEYGHKATLPQFSEKDMDIYYLSCESIGEEKDFDRRDYLYYRLPVELSASLWAAIYINQHYDELITWWNNLLLPALNEVLEDPEIKQVFITLSMMCQNN